MPLITEDIERRLYSAIITKCKDLKTEVLAIGGIEDHIHLLVRLNASISISELVVLIKGSSSHFMNHELMTNQFFKWQREYAAFTMGRSELNKIKSYIKNQKEHHQTNVLDAPTELL